MTTNSGVTREMIGKYERREAVTSLDAAKKIAKAFDRRTAERFQDIEKLIESEKDHIFALFDAFFAKNEMQAILK